MTLPLGGVRVLDLSNVLAGAFCGYHLARRRSLSRKRPWRFLENVE
jgi:hypothetical protein